MMEKTFLAIFILAFSFVQLSAQETKPPTYIRILHNYGKIPFEDGKTIISEIKFSSLDSEYEKFDETVGKIITEEDFQRCLRENRATINPDEKFYGYKVSKAAKLLREMLSSYGYPKAEINALGEWLPKNRMRLIFDVNKRSRTYVSEIRFDGNTKISDEEYINNFKECSGNGWKIFDQKAYEYYAQKCSREFMFSKGYFQGKIREPLAKIENDGYVVKFNVDEGIRYRIGEIKFEGAKVFTETELLNILDVKFGDIADAMKIRNFVYKKLQRVYEDNGYVLYDGEFDPELIAPQIEGLDGNVNLNITIYEGDQFKIGKIKFVGSSERKISEDEDKELQNNFPLKETEIFNLTKLEEGVKKLNESGKFYEIDFEKDVEIRTELRKSESDFGGIMLGSSGITIGSNKNPQITETNAKDSAVATNDSSPKVDIIIKVIKIEK